MSLEAPSDSYYSITTVGAQSLYLLFSCGKKNIPCGVLSCSVGYKLCKYCCSVVVCYENEKRYYKIDTGSSSLCNFKVYTTIT